MSDAFKTTEDELNFILGNDGGDDEHLFDNMNDDAVENGKLPDANRAAVAADDNAEFAMASYPPNTAAQTIRQAPNLNTAPVSRMISLSASSSTASFGVTAAAYGGAMDGPPPMMPVMQSTNVASQELDVFDFNFDLSDDLLPTAAVNESETGGNPQLFMPPLPPPLGTTSAYNIQMNSSRRYVPPIVHGDPLLIKSSRPFRKRKHRKSDYTTEFLDCLIDTTTSDAQLVPQQGSIPMQAADPHTKAKEATAARKMRRFKRAKSQAIHLVGGGDVTEIERLAVLDSEYTRLLSEYETVKIASLEEDLLNDFFARNFDAKMFVDLTFDSVHQSLMESCKASGDVGAVAKKGGGDAPSSECPTSPAAEAFGTPTSPSQSEQANVVTPSKKKPAKPINDQLKELPSGKDPESRRLRQLMRNRLSAQASRDRRKKAIEDLQKQKAEKDKEIVLLKKTVSEEMERMMLLEKAISFAKDHIGHERFSAVTSKVNAVKSI